MLLEKYYPGYKKEFISVEEDIKIHTVSGGSGKEAILFLHGHPENYLIWRFLTPQLEKKYNIVLTDLRGYGESSKPKGTADHSNYSKRVMARDQVAVMTALGYEKFHVISHDRGSRVAHRLVLDYPEKVLSCTFMDILPTDDMYAETNDVFAERYWHWFFYIQPDGFPEALLAKDPELFIHFNLHKKVSETAKHRFPKEVLDEFTRHFANPQTIHGICEDYRAGVTIDKMHNEADHDQKIHTPILALWGGDAILGKIWDVKAGWAKTCENLTAYPVKDCGHFVPEEQPEIVLSYIEEFLNRLSL